MKTNSMKIITRMAIACFAVAGLMCNQDGQKNYSIGDRGPAGGWIFYDKGNDSDGWRYLEAAPGDICASSRWNNRKEIERDTGKLIITGETGTAVGTGRINTEKIMKTYGDGKYAAKLCAEYRGGGKDDWFLPSKDELDLMLKNLHAKQTGNFTEFYYWSSSEVRLTYVYVRKFGNRSDFDIFGKGFGAFAIRPARSF